MRPAASSVESRAAAAIPRARGRANRIPTATNAAAIARSRSSRRGRSPGGAPFLDHAPPRNRIFAKQPRQLRGKQDRSELDVGVGSGSAMNVVARRLQVGVVAMAGASKALEEDELELVGFEDLEVLVRRLEKLGQIVSAGTGISDLPRRRSIRPADSGRIVRRRGWARQSRPARADRAADARLRRRPAARSDFRVDWNSEDESSRHNYKRCTADLRAEQSIQVYAGKIANGWPLIACNLRRLS